MKSMTPRHFKLGELYKKLMSDKLEVNESMLVENIVAQMLKASGNELFFYFNDDKEDADSRMWLDCILKSLTFASRNFCKNFLLGYYAYCE